jgi:hypothetical protein
MTVLGAALVLGGGAGAVLALHAVSSRGRPGDLIAALAAPLAIVAALAGGVLLLAPGFLG